MAKGISIASSESENASNTSKHQCTCTKTIEKAASANKGSGLSSCALYQNPQKLMLRSGRLLKRGRYLPRRRPIQVELFLVPPMIIYDDDGSLSRLKVVHLNGDFNVSVDDTDRDSFVLTHGSRRLVFDCQDHSFGHVSEWIDDISNTISMCATESLPDCADFLPFEQVIDDFHEAFELRDMKKAECAVNTMRGTLSHFLTKYQDYEGLQRLGDKYQAWFEIASARLEDLREHTLRRTRHPASVTTRSSDSEGVAISPLVV